MPFPYMHVLDQVAISMWLDDNNYYSTSEFNSKFLILKIEVIIEIGIVIETFSLYFSIYGYVPILSNFS